MDLNQELTVEFIEVWRSYPELWNLKHPQYTNKYVKVRALNALLLVLKRDDPEATIMNVKQKMERLRKNFNRENRLCKSSVRSGAAVSEVRQPRLWYFGLLSFLKDSSATTASRNTNNIVVSIEPNNGPSNNTASDTSSSIPLTAGSTSSSTSLASTSYQTRTNTRTSRNQNIRTGNNVQMSSLITEMSSLLQGVNDESSQMCLSLAVLLREIPHDGRVEMIAKMHKLLTDEIRRRKSQENAEQNRTPQQVNATTQTEMQSTLPRPTSEPPKLSYFIDLQDVPE